MEGERPTGAYDRLTLAFQAASAGTFDIPLDQDQAPAISDGALALFGFEAGQPVMFQDCVDRVHPGDRARILAAIEASVRTCTGHHVEYRVVRPDGTLVWLSSRADVELDGAGRAARLVGALLDVTERKQVEDRLRLNADLLDAVEQAVIATDNDGRILFWSRYAERLYGWAAEEVLGRPLRDLRASTLSESESAELAATVAAGGTWTGEVDVFRKDGTAFTALITDSPILVEGRQVGVVGVSHDVTAEHRAEQKLRDSEARFRGTFENAAVGIAHVAADGRWLRVNDTLCDTLRYTREQLLTMSFQHVTHPADLDSDLDQVTRLLAGEADSYCLEKRYIRGDGQIIWVNLTVSLVRDSAGQPDYFISVIEDVTERLRVEAALHDSQEFTRRVLDNLFVFVGVLDADGILIDANRAPLVAAGIESSDVIGQKFWDCYWWTWSDEVSQQVRSAVEQAQRGVAVRFDVLTRMAEDSRMWIDFQIAPLLDEAGQLTHLIPSAIDISARRQAELAMAEREEDERRGRERAELVSLTMAELEGITGLEARTSRLVDLLVPRLADLAVVSAAGDRRRVVAIAPDDRELARALGTMVFTEDAELAAGIERLGVFSHLSIPFDVGGAARGWLLVARTNADRAPFDETDVTFLTELADRVGLLLGNALLHEQEHETSLRLQRALLPGDLPQPAGVAVAARYEAGSAGLEVGGDWYDTFELPGGLVGFMVGDVMGHGIDAAAAMGRLRNAMLALAPRVSGPAELLSELHHFVRSAQVTDFATTAYAILDPKTGELRYASAGHPPLLVVHPHGSSEFLEGGRSIPLSGFEAPHQRTEGVARLNPGDTLVLYSDGLIERRRRRLSDGLALLAATAQRLSPRPAAAMCRDLVDELTAAEICDDDIVVMCAQVEASPTAFYRVLPARIEMLAGLRAAMRHWLPQVGFGPSQQFTVLLAVCEAVANAMEHGYLHHSEGFVEVRLERAGDGLDVTVADRGRWREPPADPVHRGRGTAVMQAVSVGFTRRSDDTGTTVAFSVPRQAEEAT